MLGVPKLELGEKLTQYAYWQRAEICEMLVKELESKLEKIMLEEERESPISLFQSKYNRAKNLGRREVLRSVIKDLKIQD